MTKMQRVESIRLAGLHASSLEWACHCSPGVQHHSSASNPFCTGAAGLYMTKGACGQPAPYRRDPGTGCLSLPCLIDHGTSPWINSHRFSRLLSSCTPGKVCHGTLTRALPCMSGCPLCAH